MAASSSNNTTAPPEWDVILSCSQKNLHAKIRSLVQENGFDPNHANRVGQSALHIAAVWSNIESIQVLLECGANPNAQNNITGATPLHCAIQSNKNQDRQVEAVQALVKGGADVSLGDFFGSTPADYCQDNDSLLQLLHVQQPAVFVAIQNRNVEQLRDILKQDSSVVSSRHDKLTPLLYVVNLLVQQDDDNASNTTYLEMMKLLLTYGANPNEIPTAQRNGHLNIQEDPGDAPLHTICMALKSSSTVQDESALTTSTTLLQEAAILLYKDHHATVTPEIQLLLCDAARRNQVEFATFLIQQLHVSPNSIGRQGMTPLHFCARSGKTNMVEFLLAQPNMDASIQNDLGQTALDAARVNDKQEIVALLQAHQEAK